MIPLWLALLNDDPGDAAVTPVRDETGRPVGLLSLWQGSDRPHREALQADPRLRDRAGPACVLSLALAPPEARPIADDPAVVHARRQVLRDGRPVAVSLLTADPVSIAGALTVARADRPGRWRPCGTTRSPRCGVPECRGSERASSARLCSRPGLVWSATPGARGPTTGSRNRRNVRREGVCSTEQPRGPR